MVLKTEHQQRVEEFMKLAGQEVPARITVPSEEVRRLRAKLILEEALETVEALGFHHVGVKDTTVDDYLSNCQSVEPDLVEVIDGCSDLKVVTTGTLSAFGVPDLIFQCEVDNNNLAKFGPGGYRREDGKWMKPVDHKPPKIAELIERVKSSK